MSISKDLARKVADIEKSNYRAHLARQDAANLARLEEQYGGNPRAIAAKRAEIAKKIADDLARGDIVKLEN